MIWQTGPLSITSLLVYGDSFDVWTMTRCGMCELFLKDMKMYFIWSIVSHKLMMMLGKRAMFVIVDRGWLAND